MRKSVVSAAGDRLLPLAGGRARLGISRSRTIWLTGLQNSSRPDCTCLAGSSSLTTGDAPAPEEEGKGWEEEEGADERGGAVGRPG
eukprot:2417364-Pyramimonas_sp.AAC.1